MKEDFEIYGVSKVGILYERERNYWPEVASRADETQAANFKAQDRLAHPKKKWISRGPCAHFFQSAGLDRLRMASKIYPSVQKM